MTPQSKILIVEDEILIADTIKGYIEEKEQMQVEIAISYDEAIGLIESFSPDIVLLDIRLSGSKSGIDVAEYLNSRENKIPHIFLSSQTDAVNFGKAKKTFPEAYLTKPIQPLSMLMTLEVILHNKRQQDENQEVSIVLKDHDTNHNIPESQILFVKAEHVYLRVYLKNDKNIIIRNSLKWMMDQLSTSSFMQVHRSYVVNMKEVNEWNGNVLIIGGNSIPISRGRKKETLAFFN